MANLDDARDLLGQLPEVTATEKSRWTQFAVAGTVLAYLWEPTRTIGLKQTIEEQRALVAERPDVFEVQFTTPAFGWVVVHVERVARDELAELVFEAWRLSAPADAVRDRRDELPR